MKNKVSLEIWHSQNESQEITGTIVNIAKKNNMPELYTISTAYGLYYRRKNELKFI